MKELDIVLRAIADGLKSMADGFYSISEQLNNLTHDDAEISPLARRVKKRAKVKPKVVKAAKKAAASKKKTAASTEVVYALINKANTPVDNARISEKTGYSAKKVANVVYRLKKQGKIKSVDRGTYASV